MSDTKSFGHYVTLHLHYRRLQKLNCLKSNKIGLAFFLVPPSFTVVTFFMSLVISQAQRLLQKIGMTRIRKYLCLPIYIFQRKL